MRAATDGYFRTDYSSKIVLLLNLLFFINVFELAILADHQPFPAMIVQGVIFFRLEMPVNLNQYISGDAEKNPDPKSYSAQYLKICHWNVNYIAAHNFIKIALLKAYLSVHKMVIVCLCETFLDTSILISNDNLQIPVYSSVRADHPSNTKRGDVLLYYKSFLPIKLIDANYLNECICFKLRIGGKVCKFLSLYSSPSKNRDEFETF